MELLAQIIKDFTPVVGGCVTAYYLYKTAKLNYKIKKLELKPKKKKTKRN